MTRCRNGTRMWNIFLKPNAKPTCSGYDEWQKGCAAAKVHVMPKAEPKSFEIYRSIDQQIFDGFCRTQVCLAKQMIFTINYRAAVPLPGLALPYLSS